MNPDLTLQQIAFEWARELEDEKFPGRRSEKQFFANLVSAVRRGEFGSGPFEVLRNPRAKWRRSPGPDGQDIYEINPPYLFSLDDLRKGVHPAIGKGGIPWTERDVEDDEELSVGVFWKNLILSKQKIGQWCDQKAEARPKFWFGDGRQVEPGRPRGSLAASSKRSVDPSLNRDSQTKGGKATKYDSGLQQFIDQLSIEFKKKSVPLIYPDLKTWFEVNAPFENGYQPEPHIPDCDDIEFYDGKVWWKDRSGRQKSVVIRSLERYIQRARESAPTEPG